MRKEKESTVQLKESTVVVKPKGKCAEFAVKIAGPMVIDGDGKPRDAYKPALHAAYKGLQRFIEAQDKWNTYDKALEEVKNGKKETHWMWWIFPQMRGLGKSERSQFYGIPDRDQARLFLEHPYLGKHLIEITQAVFDSDKTPYEIFGADVIKFRSCMKLFASLENTNKIFKQIINKNHWL